MKKTFKKLLSLFILVITVVFVLNNNVSLKANEENPLYQEISRNETCVLNDIMWTNIIANTKTTKPSGSEAGYGSSTPIDVNKWYGQQINMLSIPRLLDADGNQKYEVIAWSIQGDQQWNFSGMTAMAVDFEKKNPEYIVLGGINGDFYDWHSTKDYPNSGGGIEVQNGEAIRAIAVEDRVVGVKNNNDTEQLVFALTTVNYISSNPYLTIYDNNGNVVKEIELNGINNPNLNDGETSAYFPRLEIVYEYDENGNHVLNSYDEWAIKERIFHAPTLADGHKYYVINGDKVIYQANENNYYGKGKITNVNDNTEFVKNSFAVVTKNQELLSLLQKDVLIRVQYKITHPELSQSKNMMGCGEMLVEDGIFANDIRDAYYTTRAPRTIIGCKADGTVCLITMDGRQADLNFYGTNQEEINAILSELDIDDAYLLDGGGSSTFFVRENDQFIIKNSPSDGQQRSVSNGFLIVTKKDNSVKIDSISKTTNSLTFNLDSEAMADNITKSYVTINGITKEFVDNKATFENLTSDTEYEYTLSYDTENYKDIPTTTVNFVTTLKHAPEVKLGDITKDNNYFYPTITINDSDNSLQLIEFLLVNKANSKTVDDAAYDFDEPTKQIKLKMSSKVEEYQCLVTYYYRVGSGEPLEIVTLEYDLTVFDSNTEPDQGTTPNDPVVDEPAEDGCKSGFVVITPLIAACCLLIIKFKKNN